MKRLFIIAGIVLAMLLVGLALPWNMLEVGSEYRTTISSAPDVNADGFAYDQSKDRFVIALSDGTLQILPRQERSVPYRANLKYIACGGDSETMGVELLLNGDYVIAAGEIVTHSHSDGENGFDAVTVEFPEMPSYCFITIYDLMSDTILKMIPLPNTHIFLNVAFAIAGDTLYYGDSAEIHQLSLPKPWRPVQPQLLLAESGPICAMTSTPQGDGIIYGVGDEENATLKEYRGGTVTPLFSTPLWDLIACSDNYVLSRNQGWVDWNAREKLWQRSKGAAIELPHRVRVAAIDGDDIIAAMGLLGTRYNTNYPVLALLDARDGTTRGYQHLDYDGWPEAIFPISENNFLLCQVDVERPNFEYCLVSRSVSVRSDAYLALARASDEYLSPLHNLLRALYTGLRIIADPIVLLDD